METFILLEDGTESPYAKATSKELKRLLGLAEVDAELRGIWTELRRLIANGPGTDPYPSLSDRVY